jgi:hypothetical protein
MKKGNMKKLALSRETLLSLSPAGLHKAVGGGSIPSYVQCGTTTICFSRGCSAETFIECDPTGTTNEH